jgi:hypothetical protein
MGKKEELNLEKRVVLIESLILLTILSYLFFKLGLYLISNPFQGVFEVIWGTLLFFNFLLLGLLIGISLWLFGEVIISPINNYLPLIYNKNFTKFIGMTLMVFFIICIFTKYKSDTLSFWGYFIGLCLTFIKATIKLIKW